MDDSASYEPESTWDRRRKAPFHFLAKADNARMSAFVLSHTDDETAIQFAIELGYNGSPSIALYEAFAREASISIELILKAILCLTEKKPPPNTHDVYELWPRAGLPKLSPAFMHNLASITETLEWSGRYAAPTKDQRLDKSLARMRRHQRTEELGRFKVIKPTPFGWAEFNSLYQIASTRFWELDPNDPKHYL